MSVLAAILLAAVPTSAANPSSEISLWLGVRNGATLDASSTGGPGADASAAASWGLSYGWRVRPDAWMEVLFDRQSLRFEPASGSSIGRFDLSVDYLQLGGGYEPVRRGTRPYVTAALGLGRWSADPGEVRSSTSLSGSIGAGIKVPIGRSALFRLEARGWASLTSDSTAVECGGGCSLGVGGRSWGQIGVRAAIGYRPGGR